MALQPITPHIPKFEEFLNHCNRRRYPAKSTLIHAGDACDTLYYIIKGSVSVLIEDDDGREIIVAYLNTGDFFGELGLLDSDRRSATVTAETDCEVIVIERDRFLQFGDANPIAGLSVTRRIASNLASRLRRANDDVITLFAALVHEVEERI